MRDPHVAKLRYRLVPVRTVSFDQPPPVEGETEWFRMRLADDIVTFEMVEHHDSEESARQRVEPYLRAWELDVALHFGHPEISFEFQDLDIIDRDPPPPGTGQMIHAKAVAGAIGVVGNVTVHVTRRQYPEPPQAFVVSPDVETMWHCYEGYLEGRERLADMAYACLTVLEGTAGGREEAAKTYGISKGVLGTLGRLTTEIGDEQTARKFNRLKERRPHTGAERAWIEAAVKALIRRVGEWAASPEAPRPQLTMNDLPELTSS
jgi:hypothetical protein